MGKQKPQVQVMTGRVFNVYFESLYLPKPKQNLDRVTSCVVIADTADAAIRKVKEAFPKESISSFYSDDRYVDTEIQPTGKKVVF